MLDSKPWNGGRAMIWADATSRVLQDKQVVVLDPRGNIIWYYNHDLNVFDGVTVTKQQIKAAALPEAVERLIAEVGIECAMRTPPSAIRFIGKLRVRQPGTPTPMRAFEQSGVPG